MNRKLNFISNNLKSYSPTKIGNEIDNEDQIQIIWTIFYHTEISAPSTSAITHVYTQAGCDACGVLMIG